MSRYSYGWTDPRAFVSPKPFLRLRDNSDGTWSIVRVDPYTDIAKEVVAKGLKRADAERFMALANEEG